MTMAKNDDKDSNNDKGISAMGLNRDKGFHEDIFAEDSNNDNNNNNDNDDVDNKEGNDDKGVSAF